MNYKIENQNKIEIGNKVNWKGIENGIVKSIKDDNSCWVVFSCSNNWKNYQNYTGELCNNIDLYKGWITS